MPRPLVETCLECDAEIESVASLTASEGYACDFPDACPECGANLDDQVVYLAHSEDFHSDC